MWPVMFDCDKTADGTNRGTDNVLGRIVICMRIKYTKRTYKDKQTASLCLFKHQAMKRMENWRQRSTLS